MKLVDADKLPDEVKKMIEDVPAVSDFDIFTDILNRGQVPFRAKRWVSCTAPVMEGKCVYIYEGNDEVCIDFSIDGKACKYEDFEI